MRFIQFGFGLVLSAGAVTSVLGHSAEPNKPQTPPSLPAHKDDKQSDSKAQKENTEEQLFWLTRELKIPATCLRNEEIKTAITDSLTESNASSNKSFVLTADTASGSFGTPTEQQNESTNDTMPTTGKQVLSGNVQLSDGEISLAADKLTFSTATRDFSAEDKVAIDTNVGRFTADSVEGNLDTKESDLTNAEFRLKVNGANGQAKQATLENDNISLRELTFSTCPAGDESWRLKAGALDIDNEAGWGEAEDVTLEVGGVPVFYFPWLKFPTDDRRHTGLLPPSFGNTERNGFDVSAPIYINLAPNYDLTLTPRHLAKRGTQLGSEFRYLFAEHRGQIEMEFLQDREVPANEDDQRWSYRIKHLSSWEQGWQASIQAAGVSDDNYFTDLGSGLGLANFDQLKRSAEIGYHTTTFSAALSWLQFQPLSLTNEPYRQTPQLTAAWQDNSADQAWSWQFHSSYTDFSNQDNTQLSAQRWSSKAALKRHFNSSWGFIQPSVQLLHNQYQQSDHSTGTSDNISVTVPQFSLDSGLIFEKQLEHSVQTLEPRLFLLYSKQEAQDNIGLYDTYEPILTYDRLWLHNRFSGSDRIADSQQASVGLTSRILDSNRQERFSFGIGRAFYFNDRVVGLTANSENLSRRQSDIISQVSWSPLEDLSLIGQHNFDTQRSETSAGRLSLLYEPKRNFVVNLSHRFVDNEFGYREQSDIGVAVPLSDQWRVMSRWQYDLPNQRSLETMAGIEYQSCCWSIRLVTKRYLNARLDPNGAIIPDPNGRFNSDIQLQVVFRGLGSDSKPFSQLVNDSQWGY